MNDLLFTFSSIVRSTSTTNLNKTCYQEDFQSPEGTNLPLQRRCLPCAMAFQHQIPRGLQPRGLQPRWARASPSGSSGSTSPPMLSTTPGPTSSSSTTCKSATESTSTACSSIERHFWCRIGAVGNFRNPATDQRTQHAQHSNPQYTTKRRQRLRPHVAGASCCKHTEVTTGTGKKSVSIWWCHSMLRLFPKGWC